tara:strand:+ start:3306 stop:4298 length:993 start_codon:yes stop_codon:yes gene_type:complete
MAKAFKKALNAYLFNVEYGYAPPEKKGCKWQALSSDPYWTEKEEEIRKDMNNLFPIKQFGTLSKSKDKSLLKEALKKEMITWLELDSPYVETNIKYIVQDIDKINYEKKVNIPYYCTNGTTYSKIGTYEMSIHHGGIRQLLYVTEFEQKLYEIELMARELLGYSDENAYYYTTTFFCTYKTNGDKKFFSEDMKTLYNLRTRPDWVDNKQEKRNKFYEERENLGNFAPMERWKHTHMEIMIYSAEKIVSNINKITVEKDRQTLKEMFNKQAEAAGWGKVNGISLFDDLSKDSKDRTYVKNMPEKTLEERRTMFNFLLGEKKFDYNTMRLKF